MANIRLYGMIVSVFLFIAIVIGGLANITPILNKANIDMSSDDTSFSGNISLLKDSMDVFYIGIEAEQQNATTLGGDQNSYNIGMTSPVLKYTESFKNIFLSLGGLLKTSFSDLPGWFWWSILGIISFTFLWKVLEAWLGRDA